MLRSWWNDLYRYDVGEGPAVHFAVLARLGAWPDLNQDVSRFHRRDVSGILIDMDTGREMMKLLSVSVTALIMSVGLAAAQAPMQPPAGGGADFRAGEGRRQQEGGTERIERRQQRMEQQETQVDRGGRGGQRQEDRAERRWDNEDRKSTRLNSS